MRYDGRMPYRTDDVRIQSLRPLLPPGILMEEVPETPEATALVALSREAIGRILARPGRPPARGGGPLLHPRPGGRPRVRAPPPREGRSPSARTSSSSCGSTSRSPGPRWAGRGSSTTRGSTAASRSTTACACARRFLARPGRARAARRHGVPRPDHPPVPRRPRVVGGDRRPHLREPGAPRAGLRPLACRWASRTAPTAATQGRDRGDRQRLPPAPLPERHQAGRGRDRGHPRQPRLPPHPARRQPRPELRARAGGRGDRGASRRRVPAPR